MKLLQLILRGVIRRAGHWQALLGLKSANGLLCGIVIRVLVNRAFVKAKIGQSGLETTNRRNRIEVAQLQSYDLIFGPSGNRLAGLVHRSKSRDGERACLGVRWNAFLHLACAVGLASPGIAINHDDVVEV